MFCVFKWTIREFPKQTKATENADLFEKVSRRKAEKSLMQQDERGRWFGFLKPSHNIWVLSALSAAAGAAPARKVWGRGRKCIEEVQRKKKWRKLKIVTQLVTFDSFRRSSIFYFLFRCNSSKKLKANA